MTRSVPVVLISFTLLIQVEGKGLKLRLFSESLDWERPSA